MDEGTIQQFWNRHPCGDHIVGGLRDSFDGEHEQFFTAYDHWRYTQESHIPACLDGLRVEGLDVLEVGLGQGAESEQLIRRGAHWSGVDITSEAVDRTRTRLRLRGLPYEELQQASVLDLPFADNSFDLVFSHGVLHHVPDILSAQHEIHRVLRPQGRLAIMLYARHSLNYQVSIRVVRRLALALLYPAWRWSLIQPRGIVAAHLENAREVGLKRYLELDHFTHRSTDGPHNPYAIVYSIGQVGMAFPDFEVLKSYKRYLHAPPLPTKRLSRIHPLEDALGWHLWVEMGPRQVVASSANSSRV